MSGDILKFGIVGLGKMGRIRAKTIEAHPHAELIAGADPSPACWDHFKGIKLSKDYRDVIDSDVDAVVVCTPNRFTPEVVMHALDAGKHVFSEKPPGRSLQDIHAIIETEKRNPGQVLKFGFNHRFHEGVKEAKRIVDSGRLGHILWIRGIYGKAGSDDFEQQWRSDKELCGGGILLDQGIHMLDLLRLFLGDFKEIKSMCTTAYWDIPVEDNAFALLRDERGRIAMIHSSSTQWKHRFNLEIYMSNGYLAVNGILSASRSYGDETISLARKQFDDGFAIGKPREEIIYFDTDPSWELELQDFIDAIQKNQPLQAGASYDALKAMELVFSIYNDDSSWVEHMKKNSEENQPRNSEEASAAES